MNHPKQVTYRGVVYKRNPNSDDWPKRVYYQAPRGSGRGYLHRDVYADTNGPIPDGMHVHHKDHDPFNNAPSNLVLMTPREHRQEHARKFTEERLRIHRETTLAAAAKWHGSEEGIAWHREHGRRTWENRATSTFTCPECGVTHEGHFPGRSGEERYCSQRCRQRVIRRLGLYQENVTCPVCSSSFKRMRGKSKPECCSRSCGAKLRWQRQHEDSEPTDPGPGAAEEG